MIIVPFIASADSVSVILNNRPRQVSLKTDQGQKLLAALRENPQNVEKIAEIANIPLYVARLTQGRVEIGSDDQIRIDKRIVDYGLRAVILRVLVESGDVSALASFLQNVDENPDKEVSKHLYSFIEKGGMPLTPDGHFLAFKRVQKDYTSFHCGREDVGVCSALRDDGSGEITTFRGHIPHREGTILGMDRVLCNPRRDQTCSVGLHACSFNYLPNYCSSNGRVMIVKINPRDVVAVPYDYNDAKLRSCRLVVVGEVAEDQAEGHFTTATDARYENSEQDSVVEEPQEPTLVDVGNWAVEDAMYDVDHLELAAFDPKDGNRYWDVPDNLKTAYRVSYTIAFEDECELNAFHSEKALRLGFDDGHSIALGHADGEDEGAFAPDYTDGTGFEHLPKAHDDTYVVGFLRGYLSGWNLYK